MNAQVSASVGHASANSRAARRVDAARGAADADRSEEKRLGQLLEAVEGLRATRGANHAQIDALTHVLRSLARAMLTDSLTGLRNRRGFLHDGEQLLALAAQRQLYAGVFFFDVDRLKLVNDTSGHAAGDEVLRTVALALRATFRRSDAIARLAGDEFAAVALMRRESDGARVLRRLELALRDSANACAGGPVHLTAGVAVRRPDVRTSLEELLEEADQIMYRNKRARPAAGGVTVTTTLGAVQTAACHATD